MPVTQDLEYGIRASKRGKFGMLTHDKAIVNVRRFEDYGRLNVWGKWIVQSIAYKIFGKKYTKFPWKYH